ncbi:MAG: tryptophan 7-halogenase, partial [Opitutaceae bacterium]
MTKTDYDVLIIGGGPAGSSAAAYARQHNLRTLLVEKLEFPRFRIGESLLPTCNALLREIGVWPQVEAAGFFPKYGAMFYLAHGPAEKEVDFRHSLIPGLESAYQVDRAKFDSLLLENARSRGTEVRMQTSVRAVESDGAGNRVELEGPAGKQTMTARWVLDASGRDNFFTTGQKRTLDPPSSPKRMAVYAHFRQVPRPSGRRAGHTVVVRLET